MGLISDVPGRAGIVAFDLWFELVIYSKKGRNVRG